jgi:hypothetical protein
MTLDEWWEISLAEVSNRNTTLMSKQSVYRTHIRPMLGAMKLSDITEHEILVFRKHLEETGLKPNSVNLYMVHLCGALSKAYKREMIKKYPCQDIGTLKVSKTDIQPLTFDELAHLLAVLKAKRTEWYDL